jgi:uncharacterized delta-60 repeat protein
MGAAWLLAVAMAWAHGTGADGTPDPTFGDGGIAYVTPDDVGAREVMPVEAVELPDGKLLFGGTRNKILDGWPVYEPQIRGALVRLLADGSPDPEFGNTGIAGLVELPDLAATRMQGIESMVLLPDGSVMAGGTSMVDGPMAGFVAHLRADGTLDPGFGNGGARLLPGLAVHAVGVDGDGRAYAAGERFDADTYVNTSTVVRLDAAGSLDPSFGSGGEVAIGWSDPSASGYLNDLVVTATGGVIVGGGFEAWGAGWGTQFAIARLDATGALDDTFAGSGWRVFDNPAETSTSNGIHRLLQRPDGSIAFAGAHTSGENMTGLILGQLTVDGASDGAFGNPSTPGWLVPAVLPEAQTVNATALVRQPDGKLLVSAAYYSYPDRQDMVVVRTTADGRIDDGFATAGVMQFDASQGGVYSESSAMALLDDGRIVVAGRAMRSPDSPVVDFAAIRLENAPGAADRVFADGFEGGA